MRTAERLIIFYKNPQLGKVKTRLAATLGEEMALAIYLRLAAHTRLVTQLPNIDTVVYYSDYIDYEDEWKGGAKALQQGSDLGARMCNAFRESFALGYQAVCIIGTDCLQLQAQHLKDAFLHLQQKELVVGPAEDGGYYLLGMKQFHPSIFENKVWSSSNVLAETLGDAARLALSWVQLPKLSDIDEEKDLPPDWKKRLQV